MTVLAYHTLRAVPRIARPRRVSVVDACRQSDDLDDAASRVLFDSKPPAD